MDHKHKYIPLYLALVQCLQTGMDIPRSGSNKVRSGRERLFREASTVFIDPLLDVVLKVVPYGRIAAK
eukprot:scaffold23498_cov62-Attheya_sp.AAC.1